MALLKPSTTEPWERQGAESTAAFAAFCHFRDAGELRQLKATASAMKKDYSLIRRWAAKFLWHERTLAYDNFMQRIDIAERREERREMRRRHARIAKDALQKVVDRLNALEVDELSAEQVMKWLDVATKVERMALEELPAGTAPPPAIINMDVDIDHREFNLGTDRSELAAYLDRHPEKIPQIIPAIERLLQQGTDVLRLEEKDVTPEDARP